ERGAAVLPAEVAFVLHVAASLLERIAAGQALPARVGGLAEAVALLQQGVPGEEADVGVVREGRRQPGFAREVARRDPGRVLRRGRGVVGRVVEGGRGRAVVAGG